MDFARKNWLALTLAILSFVGLILSIVWLAEAGGDFMLMTTMIAWMLFFLGMFVFFLKKMFMQDKKAKCFAWTLLLTGLLVTIFAFIGMIDAIDMVSGAPSPYGVLMVVPRVLPIIALGLFPLFFGLAKLLKKDDAPN